MTFSASFACPNVLKPSRNRPENGMGVLPDFEMLILHCWTHPIRSEKRKAGKVPLAR